jgi:UDP-N-acetylmuramyl pentapeptide phosphotransferase/UDP-N-acetylglucosamine-1-phosphate transferase
VIVVLVFTTVFVVSWWLSGRLCDPSSRFYLLDHPNERSLHERPTPRTGGLAVLTSAALGLELLAITNPGNQVIGLNGQEVWILGAAAVLAAVSFCDDRWGLSPIIRFGVHGATAMAVVIGAGLRLPAVWLPVVGETDLAWASFPITVLFLMWMTNLYNFMDGMDGFAGGMTMLGFAFLAFLGWHAGHLFMFVTALVLSIGAAGFLFHNFPPARIFMGDVGSVPIGFMSGALALLGMQEHIFDLWVPLLLFSPFVVDATITLVRRLVQKQKIWEAHRSHYYQRLVLAGWGHKRTVLVEYGLMLLCGALALLYQAGDELQRTAVLAVVGAVYLALIAGVQFLERKLPL